MTTHPVNEPSLPPSWPSMDRKRLRLYVPLFFSVFLLVFFYASGIDSLVSAARMVALSAFYSLAASEAARWLALRTRLHHPGLKHTRTRLLRMLRLGIPLVLLVSLADELFTILVGQFPVGQIRWRMLWWDYVGMVGVSLLCSLVVIALYEGLYYIENWKVLFAESERLKKMNLNSQYQFLKDQVKPHFLFNSLNTLLSLVHADPTQAEAFITEMASVYRYLLTKKERELATLGDELAFLNSYVLMLKTRFGDSLQIRIDIHPDTYPYLLPPFVLQLLVENAVKHNIVSRQDPLWVSLTSDAQHNLIVANNIQRKPKPEPSEKTGLSNLITRYQLLKKEDQLYITEEGGVFKVVLPLLESGIYEPIAPH